MRKPLLLAVLLLAGAALAGIGLNTSGTVSILACAAGGSAAQALTGGQWMVTVQTADTFLCTSSTCATGGHLVPAGTMFLMQVPGGPTGLSVSCRSTGSTGNIYFTPTY